MNKNEEEGEQRKEGKKMRERKGKKREMLNMVDLICPNS